MKVNSVVLTKPDEAILFYITDLKDRSERLKRLVALAGTAYAAKDLRQIVAIATESMTSHGRSFDVVAYKDVIMQNKAELKEQAERMFGEGKHHEGYLPTQKILNETCLKNFLPKWEKLKR